jgi:hypothetical protein
LIVWPELANLARGCCARHSDKGTGSVATADVIQAASLDEGNAATDWHRQV